MRAKWLAGRAAQLVLALVLVQCCYSSSFAQKITREAISRSTVGIVAGQSGDLSARLVADLAAVLDEGKNLRVLAVAGRGGLSDIADILFLRGMSLAIISEGSLHYAESENLYPSIRNKLRYISRLYTQAVHLVTRADITNIKELQGREINVVSKHHQSFATAQTVFGAIGLKYKPVYIDQRLALDKIKKGELAAALIVSGRPSPLLLEIEQSASLNIIGIPFQKNLPDVYYPTNLSSDDYPEIISPGQIVNSVGTAAVLMVYDFSPRNERYGKIARFVDSFLSRLTELQQPPRHPRWQDLNLAAAVKGMQRFGPVAEWLKSNKPQVVAKRATPKRSLRRTFEAFIESQAAAGQTTELLRSNKADLFKRYVAWRRSDGGALLAKPKRPKRSLKELFRQFIADEVARIGKSNVLALGKPELYRRFLEWRRQGQISSYSPVVVARKSAAPQRRSLKQLFRQFIALEVSRIGKSDVLALSRPELYRRFLDWRRKGTVSRFSPLPPRQSKSAKKPKRSLKELFRQFISTEVARIGKTNVLALSKPELYRRFLNWRRGNSPTTKKTAAKRSLKVLFQQFVADEVARVGRDQVLALSKSELYGRFLQWRKRGETANRATEPKPAKKKVAKPKRSQQSLFAEFIQEEIARIGRDKVYAASKPKLFQRFLNWRRQRAN